ncbi:hypothetical protein RFI02_17110 [Acinetobacter sichuanensis]|uniref:hypothetical protein n=1 Tax=Acinetobacter sichuanensis TaxID=2136183 RepID=UPI00280D2672|nr:hypothetical protein [Acinetobacter sichuanensis]MDQ9022827.1 hypothetical protein [Acinetobacter sichuanensis]
MNIAYIVVECRPTTDEENYADLNIGDDSYVFCSVEYQAFEVKRSATNRTLDQEISITFADFDDALMKALKKTNRLIEPHFKYRQYRDDDLDDPVIVIQTLEITDVNKDASGFVTFDAKAVQLNNVKTGEVYTVENCPLLRGA